MPSKKNENKNILNKDVLIKRLLIFILLAVFLLFSPSNFVLDKESESESFSMGVENVYVETRDFLDLLGRATLKIYLLYGEIVYFSIKQVDDLGDGVITTYLLTGNIVYTGIKSTVIFYSNLLDFSAEEKQFEKKHGLNLDSYSANVLGGLEMVKQDVGSHFYLVNKSFIDSLSSISFSVEPYMDVFNRGLNNFKIMVFNFSKNFLSNIKLNAQVVSNQLRYLTASVYTGVDSLFNLKDLKKEYDGLFGEIKKMSF